MAELVSFFVILLAAILFTTAFKRFHVPWVVALIVAGLFIGPFGVGLIEIDATIDFLAEVGLIFLMFIAGMETKLSRLENARRESFVIAVINGLIPFTVGVSIAFYFGYGVLNAFMVGMVFISSSIAASLPTMETNKLMDTRVGTAVIGSTMMQDIFSLLILGAFLQFIDPSGGLPLAVFTFLLLGSFIVLLKAIPFLKSVFIYEETHDEDQLEKEVRLVVALLLGTVAFYELIGLDPIVAGFIAGLLLSEVIESETLINKVHAIGYGIFIPIFFVVIGSRTDLSVFLGAGSALAVTTAIVLGSMVSKYVSGIIAGGYEGFTRAESSLIGSTSIPQLSTTLAVIFIGSDVGLLDQQLTTALIILSIVTTATGPILINATLSWVSDEKLEKIRNSGL